MDFNIFLSFVSLLMATMAIGLTSLVITAIAKWIWSIATTSEEESLTEKIGFKRMEEMLNK